MITIHGKVPSKKNSRKVFVVRGHIVFAPSTDYEKWHRAALKEVMAQTGGQCGCQEGKKICRIEINIYAPDLRKSDLTNKAESVMDLLVDSGYLKGDDWFEVPQLTLSFGGVDRKDPRAEVFIDVA